MANPNIKIKRSAVPGKRPTVDQLPLGELGLNTYDGQLFAQIDTGGVGIATTVATLTPWKESYGSNSISYDGNVSVGSNLTVQNAVLNGTLSVGSTTGQSGQYLQSTGVGVTWASFPTLRTTNTFSATSGQTSFNVNYNVGFIDVYINGVRLTDSDYTASNGTSVVLNESCYGGEVVDIIAYNTTSTSGSGSRSGISTEYQTLNDVLGLGNTSTRGMSVGVITATSYNGSGATLSGIVTNITAGYGISVNQSSGNVTITAVGSSEGSWTVSAGSGTYSFTVPTNANYVMWMRGNIPNGICVWNATVSISNPNVPVIGNQYGWYYTAGNQLVLTAIPNQIIGTSGSIITSSPAVSNTNTFSFGITNNSGTNQTVVYGYKTI
jgi:hypothetical protein